ncbi:hypothetical protein FS837_008515 [Tulasnella sp. UAMH 9824]|nr:hypothetical protein FS837_008515 [Tulasnella sp. UAMH 9824]
MAILLRTRAASAFLLPFRRQLYFPVAARALSTSKIASFPLKKADGSESSTATTSVKNPRKSTSKASKASGAKDTDSKKKKAKKEPKLYSKPPKGRIAANVLFATEKLPLFQGPVTERMKAVTAQWKSLSADEKQVWATRAEEINTKRREELEAWEAQQSPEALQQYRKDKRQRYRLRATQRAEALGTTGLKQRGTRPFFFLIQAYKMNPERFELPVVEPANKNPAVATAMALGQLWRSMTLGEKAPYIAQAEEDDRKVKQELAKHLAEKVLQSRTA